jgi:transcription elongation GreA/GreB family factor
MDSPLGRALLGRSPGDEITVERPKGRVTFTVIGIRYDDDAR